MAYDDVKEFGGETYSGMAVGGEHTWLYPNGLWKETKVAPDRWDFTFKSIKERERSAPPGFWRPGRDRISLVHPGGPTRAENRRG